MKTVPGAALLALLLALSGNAVPGQHTDEFRFNVWFDQKPIGSHAFSISTDQATLNVRSNARFEFKLLFVPVYQYDHEAVEVWQGNCLESVNSTTRDNGKRYRVDLRPQDLLAETDCAGSFAYWDLQKLKRSRILNAQTGTFSDLQLTYEGKHDFRSIPANRYRLFVDDSQVVTLWYRQSDDRWIGLETERDKGTLRYLAEEI